MEVCDSFGDVDDLLTCNNCENTVISFLILCENEENLINFLYKHKVLPKTKICMKCNVPMWLNGKKYKFKCNKQFRVSKGKYVNCNYSVSQLKGTFFERHHVGITKICKFVVYWSLLPHPRQDFLKQELDMASTTIVEWSNYMREVCKYFINNNSEPLGGIGKTVEIDEVKIGQKNTWIIGGIERESKKTFISPMTNRSEETLFPIIKEYILPGTTVVSNCWKTYDCHQSEEYQHLTVNNLYNFVDSETGENMQMIEKFWSEVRLGIPKCGKQRELHGHLAEFLFKRKFNIFKERLHHIWIAISTLYNGRH